MSAEGFQGMRNEEIDSTRPIVPLGGERLASIKSQWIKLTLLVLLISGITILALKSGLKDWMDPDRIKALIEGWGLLAPFVYMFVMTLAVIISPIPSLPLNAAAGAVFGPLMGTVYSVFGAGAGALASFFIARALGREVITRLLKSDIGFCKQCSERNLFYVILLARLLPAVSFDLISYGAGLTRMSPRGFALATFFGMIPPTFMLNYFGSGIFAGSGFTIILGGLLMLLSLLVPKWLKRHNPWGLYDRLEIQQEDSLNEGN